MERKEMVTTGGIVQWSSPSFAKVDRETVIRGKEPANAGPLVGISG